MLTLIISALNSASECSKIKKLVRNMEKDFRRQDVARNEYAVAVVGKFGQDRKDVVLCASNTGRLQFAKKSRVCRCLEKMNYMPGFRPAGTSIGSAVEEFVRFREENREFYNAAERINILIVDFRREGQAFPGVQVDEFVKVIDGGNSRARCKLIAVVGYPDRKVTTYGNLSEKLGSMVYLNKRNMFRKATRKRIINSVLGNNVDAKGRVTDE